MNGTHASKDGIIPDDHMTGNLGIVAHHTIVTYNAVVRQMAVGLDQAIAPDGGFFPVLGATVDGDEFADGCIVADKNIGVFALEFEILRNGGNDRTGKYSAVVPDPCSFHDCHIRSDPGSFSDFHILMDNRERIYLHICGDPGVGMNISMGMD